MQSQYLEAHQHRTCIEPLKLRSTLIFTSQIGRRVLESVGVKQLKKFVYSSKSYHSWKNQSLAIRTLEFSLCGHDIPCEWYWLLMQYGYMTNPVTWFACTLIICAVVTKSINVPNKAMYISFSWSLLCQSIITITTCLLHPVQTVDNHKHNIQ